MAYDSPFSGPYGGAGPALPPGYMETATQPGRDVQGLLKSIGEKFKERREKKKQEAKELKATRSLAKALGVERIGLDDSSIETADVDTIMGKIQAWQAKNKERELAVREAPGRQDEASMKMIQQALGAEAGRMGQVKTFGGEFGIELGAQDERRLQGIQNLLPAIEQNLGANPDMVDRILELSQGGGGRPGDITPGPEGSWILQAGKGAFSVIKGADKPQTALEAARTKYYGAQEGKVKAQTRSEELYHALAEKFGGGKIDTSKMTSEQKRSVTALEKDIEQAQINLKRIDELGNDAAFIDYQGDVVDKVKSRKAQKESQFWKIRTRADAKSLEEEKIKSAQAKLAKLRGGSGGAAIPRPPVTEIDPMAPENLFPSE